MQTKMMYLLMILCVSWCMGCQSIESEPELEDQNKELAKQYIETINTGDFEALEKYLSADFSIYSPSGYPEPTSREKLIENYNATKESFSEFNWNIEDMLAAEDMVVCRVTITGIFNGTIPGLATTEKEFRFSLITIMRMKDGKVVQEWQEDDQLGFARQMGMELKPKDE